MDKSEFFKKMDTGALIFPENNEQLEWQEEYYALHPELQEEAERAYNDLTERQAAQYMAFKILARLFIENNGQGVYLAKVEKRKITISKHLGEIGFYSAKLEINL